MAPSASPTPTPTPEPKAFDYSFPTDRRKAAVRVSFDRLFFNPDPSDKEAEKIEVCPAGDTSQKCTVLGYFLVDEKHSSKTILSLSWRSDEEPKGVFAPSSLVFTFEADAPHTLKGASLEFSDPAPGVPLGRVTLLPKDANRPIEVKAGHAFFCGELVFTAQADYQQSGTDTVAVSFSSVEMQAAMDPAQRGDFGQRDICPSPSSPSKQGLSTGALAGISIGEKQSGGPGGGGLRLDSQVLPLALAACSSRAPAPGLAPVAAALLCFAAAHRPKHFPFPPPAQLRSFFSAAAWPTSFAFASAAGVCASMASSTMTRSTSDVSPRCCSHSPADTCFGISARRPSRLVLSRAVLSGPLLLCVSHI